MFSEPYHKNLILNESLEIKRNVLNFIVMKVEKIKPLEFNSGENNL